jgi:hypothetical protein
MPCMGPAINEQQFEEAYKEIMELLASKYDIQKHEPLDIVTCMWNRAWGSRCALNSVFKDVLRQLFMQQSCEDF